MKKLWQNYSLSIVLFVLFISSWAGQGYFQWQEFVSTQAEHSQEPKIDEFISEFMSSTFENWQSEFLQLFTFVVLATYFIHKDSPQSRDGDDKMQASLSRIEKALGSKDLKTH